MNKRGIGVFAMTIIVVFIAVIIIAILANIDNQIMFGPTPLKNTITNEDFSTPISDCGIEITRGGKYHLVNNLYTEEFICINIAHQQGNSHVTIDCKGHSISGPPNYTESIAIGINQMPDSLQTQLTVKNCFFKSLYQALSLRTHNSTAINNTFYSRFGVGIVIKNNVYNIEGVNIEGNTFYDADTYEIASVGSNNARLYNNNFCKSTTPYIKCYDNDNITGSSKFNTNFYTNCQDIMNVDNCPVGMPE